MWAHTFLLAGQDCLQWARLFLAGALGVLSFALWTISSLLSGLVSDGVDSSFLPSWL